MSNWFAKSNSHRILYQSSDIPYIMFEDGILLCFDNFYYTDKTKQVEQHQLSFYHKKQDMKRKNAWSYRLSQFPVTIPYEQVKHINNTGHDPDQASQDLSVHNEKSMRLMMISTDCANSLDDDKTDDLSERIHDSKYDKIIILSDGDELGGLRDIQTSITKIIFHADSWPRTIATIADIVAQHNFRGINWTAYLPQLYIDFFGLKDNNELDSLRSALSIVGIYDQTEISISDAQYNRNDEDN